MQERRCGFCERALRAREPTYPVRFEDADVDIAVCVHCAQYLAQQGVGAWTATNSDRSATE